MGFGYDVATLGVGLATAVLRRASRAIAPQPPVVHGRRGSRSYDGAAVSARNDGWFSVGSSANAEVGSQLSTLRNRSRELVRNNAFANRARRSFVSNLIGVGLSPVWNTGSEKLDRAARDLWDSWSRRCSSTSRLPFRGVQAMLAGAWFLDGEVLIRFRPRFTSDLPGLPPFQLQVLEGDYLDETLYLDPSGGSGRVVQGIELDPLDRRVAYHLWRSHPGDVFGWSGNAFADRSRVPAGDVIHLLTEDRPGQLRGAPMLHPVMQALWDLGSYQDAERVKQRASATLVAVVEGGEESYDEDLNPDGVAPTTDDSGKLLDGDGNPVEKLKPGWVTYAPTGKVVKFNPTVASQGYAENVRVSLHEIAAGLGLSYEVLTGDLSQVNFSSIRLGLNEQYRFLRALREQVFAPLALDPILERWVTEAMALRLLPDEPALYGARWSSPQIESVDRKTDAEADALEITNRLRSRRSCIESRGEDPDDVDREIALDQKNRDKLGISMPGDAPKQAPTPSPLAAEQALNEDEPGA